MHVSISDAAGRLTALGDRIDRSTLSRYLKQHAEALPLRREGRTALVEWEALLAHRRENIRVAGPVGVPAAEPVPLTAGSAAPGARSAGRPGGTQADGAARKVNAEAEIKELELAIRRGALVPKFEVERAADESVALMMAAFERAIETSASSASLKYGWDERQIRLVLKTHVREAQGVFHRELLTRLDALASNESASPGEVGARS